MLGTLQVLGERNSQLKNENSDGFILLGGGLEAGKMRLRGSKVLL